jgi:hypothetical protein
MNPSRKRKLLKIRARQAKEAKAVTPVAPVEPAKRKRKKSTQVPETVTEKKETLPVVEEPKPKSTKRKRSWNL